MINCFLSDVLGYRPLVKINGLYDQEYLRILCHPDRENKVLSCLSQSPVVRPLRESSSQTINYGANEGIEYALLTNGKPFEFYKIPFRQADFCQINFHGWPKWPGLIKSIADYLLHFDKHSIVKNKFRLLWNKCEATGPRNDRASVLLWTLEIVFLREFRSDVNAFIQFFLFFKNEFSVVVTKFNIFLTCKYNVEYALTIVPKKSLKQ